MYLREIGVHTPFCDLDVLGEPACADKSEPQPESVIAPAVAEPSVATEEPVVPLSKGSSVLDELARQAATCTACTLAEERTQVVFGVGNPDADLLFIGEAPGRDEDLKGEPFVGRAGQLLDRMLAASGLERSQIYIMNTVKCRPPNNRDPRPEEVHACSRWFDAQLRAVNPKVICLLGRVAAQMVLESDAPLSAMRGRWHDYRGIPVRVLYHPAYLLRSPQQKQAAWQDLLILMQRYRSLSGD